MTTSEPISEEPLVLRTPTLADASRLWSLARASDALEENSAYAYLLLCGHFARTARVAELGSVIVGFVVGYRPPDAPDVLFVWQVGTERAARGRGVAGGMLRSLVDEWRPRGVRFLEATVTPSNEASKALFRGVARSYGVACAETSAFPSRYFPDPAHEDEILFRIGPFEGDD